MAKSAPQADSMEQVRDLLLGTQLKDMENRFKRQEDNFVQELADLRDSLKKRMESLENFMKSEVASLLHRLHDEETERAAVLKSEQRERAEAIKNEQRDRSEAIKTEQRERMEALAQIVKDMSMMEEAFERKLASVSGTLDKTERELRQLLLAENARLSDSVDEKYKDALNALSKVSNQIRHDMASRSAVSGLFTEMALKLSGQWANNASSNAYGEESSILDGDETIETDSAIENDYEEPQEA